VLGTRLSRALDTLGSADPRWLWLAAVGLALGIIGSAGSWRSAIALVGGRTSLIDATARYGAGSLVNTFVPARAGDAVRLGLFSRLLAGAQPLRTTGGAFAALGAARAFVLGALVVAGAFAGAVPLWPLVVAAALVAAGIAVAVRARHSRAHILDAFRALGTSRSAGLRLVGWIALSIAGRLAAATAVGAALGIGRPLLAALVIIPALDVSGILPVTPGNVGVANAAIAIAYRLHGVSFDRGIAAGITFQALETGVSVTIGIASILWLTPYRTATARKAVLVGGAASYALAIGSIFGATVVVPLV
jgi:phosphatidylinositol alpha-mannosyltransferase